MKFKLILAACSMLSTLPLVTAQASTLERQSAQFEPAAQSDSDFASKHPAAWGGYKTEMGAEADWQSVPLTDIDNAASTMISAQVETEDGIPVGEVRNVVTDDEGKASAVVLEASNDDRFIKIDANQFVYKPDRNILVTSLSSDDIDNMP